MSFNKVMDSGARQNFETGSRRDTQTGKGRYDLLNPIVMSRLAKHFENGAKKYGDHNWELGQPCSRYMDSLMRHAFKFLEGHRDEDHLAAIMWNAGGVIYTQEMIDRGLLPEELDDLPDYLREHEFQRTIVEPCLAKVRADNPMFMVDPSDCVCQATPVPPCLNCDGKCDKCDHDCRDFRCSTCPVEVECSERP
jgi:hypothetical protein